jgi:integrase/recombinase XerD
MFLLDRVYRNLTSNSVTGYRAYLKALGQDLENWGVSHLELAPTDLTHRMISNMMDQGYKETTINGRIRTCQQFYKFLFKEGVTETNIASSLKPIKCPQTTIHTLNPEQIHSILQQPKLDTFTGIRDYAIILTFLDTGIRVFEMANLKLSDIDFEQNCLKIIYGKGRKSRTVPIQKTCINHLKIYIQERGNQKFDYLWVSVFNTPFARFSIIDMIATYYKKSYRKKP